MRGIWSQDLAERLDSVTRLVDSAARSVKDSEVLHGQFVLVFQAAERDALRLNVSPVANHGEGVDRRPAAFFEAVEGEGDLRAGDDARQLFDLKVFGKLLKYGVNALRHH